MLDNSGYHRYSFHLYEQTKDIDTAAAAAAFEGRGGKKTHEWAVANGLVGPIRAQAYEVRTHTHTYIPIYTSTNTDMQARTQADCASIIQFLDFIVSSRGDIIGFTHCTCPCRFWRQLAALQWGRVSTTLQCDQDWYQSHCLQ